MTPSTPSYLTSSWGNLSWTEWVPLEKKNREISRIPTEPGLYRVRPVDDTSLAYIGQTGRPLRKRIQELRRFYNSPNEMPWNDPHTAAPSLWAYRDAEGWDFEVSVARLPDHGGSDGRRHRMGQEARLLWKYRCEKDLSTHCNHGRFHKHYYRSTNRSTGRRGGRLPTGEINPAGGESSAPLRDTGSPKGKKWMCFSLESPLPLEKPSLKELPEIPGIYMMLESDCEVVYVGETHRLRSRLLSHAKGKFHGKNVHVSYVLCPDMTEHYQRLEWENDCIGAWVERTGEPPKWQFYSLRVMRQIQQANRPSVPAQQ